MLLEVYFIGESPEDSCLLKVTDLSTPPPIFLYCRLYLTVITVAETPPHKFIGDCNY